MQLIVTHATVYVCEWTVRGRSKKKRYSSGHDSLRDLNLFVGSHFYDSPMTNHVAVLGIV